MNRKEKTMPKYIDADALLAEAKRLSGPMTGDGWSNWGVYALIERQPAANVAPVKHGKWTFDPLGGDWKCSECDLHSMEHGKYCPNCGTKMDKEGE